MKTPENVPDNSVGRKTPEEIKKRLCCCVTNIADCKGCPFDNSSADGLVWECTVDSSALAYIQQLESRLAQAERERDAAVADILHVLHTKGTIDAECLICDMEKPDCRWECEKAKWRGVCPENTKEDA